MVDFDSGQGLSVFATDGVAITAIAGIVWLFRGLQKSENAAMGQKMPFPDGHKLTISSWEHTNEMPELRCNVSCRGKLLY
jgi:hypothetical protein